MYGWYGWYGDGWGWGSWLATSLLMLVFWGVIVAAVVMIVRYVRSERPSGAGSTPEATAGADGDRAMRILEERFARGEIDAEEFADRRERLVRP